MADETGLDFTDQIVSLEHKYQQVRASRCLIFRNNGYMLYMKLRVVIQALIRGKKKKW